jgi:hemolysin III
MAPSIWAVQRAASWQAIGLSFLLIHLANAFAEYLFHRYMLHAPLVPFFGRLCRRHTLHHGLTHIVFRRQSGTVANAYPIVELKQREASFFPWYATIGFAVAATPAFAFAQWLLPNMPVFFAGWAAIAWNLVLYEVFHMFEHKPFSWWQPLFGHSRWGRFWQTAYGFHLRHHADIRSNEAISGFFGLPIADWLFGTYVKPRMLYEDGTTVTTEDFQSTRPVWFIRWLDGLAERAIRRAQHAAV